MSSIKQKCKDCGNFFEITDKEQSWYREMNFTLPKRCKSCRDARKEENNGPKKNKYSKR